MTISFDDLDLHPALLDAVRAEGYQTPTPIQAKAIPQVRAGHDVLGCAQTGTGKTAAFALPILERLLAEPPVRGRRPIRVLVLAPTRELAAQIGASFQSYGARTHLNHTVIFGGVGQLPQTRALERGVDVLVATPGRLLDLMGQGFVHLRAVEVFVLDEADRMLDMGFIHDIRRVVAVLPPRRQTLLFSATLAPEIRQLAAGLLVDPVEVSVTPPASTVERIAQSVMAAEKADKIPLLIDLLDDADITRALVFSRTKHGADKVVRKLVQASVPAAAIHGNRSQGQRERALEAFKKGACRVLVATDIAARGLDIDEVSHVINLDLPHEPEVYVHRIGRTARAGASGIAISFCSMDERPLLKAIERTIRRPLDRDDARPVPVEAPRAEARPRGEIGRTPPQGGDGQPPAARSGRGRRRGRGRAPVHG